jgi:hypothetical protein
MVEHADNIQLFAGIIGWVLLTVVLQLGWARPAMAILRSLMLGLVMLFVIAVLEAMLVIPQHALAWRTICLFVFVPYAFSGARIYGLVRRSHRRGKSPSAQP